MRGRRASPRPPSTEPPAGRAVGRRNVRTLAASTRHRHDGDGDIALDARGRLALYLAVGARRRRGDRAADRHHARVRGRQLDAFRLARRQPRDARLRPHQRGDGVGEELVRAPLARRRERRARPDGAARGRRQSLYPAARLQPDLSRLRPEPEVEAGRDLPRLADAVPRRRGVPRLRVPEEQQDLRPRLFRRSRRLRPQRPRVSRRDVSVPAGQPDRRAARAVVRRLPRLDASARRARRARSLRRRRRRSRSAAISSPRPTLGLCRGSRSTTTRAPPTRAGCPKRRRCSRATRRSACSRPTRPPICISRRAFPTTPASTCRRCRPTPIWASTSTATARSA